MEKYNKQKAILTALLKWVETEFFGIFVFLFFIAVAKPFGALANIIFGLTGLLTVVCLMADFGLKQGEEARNKVTFHGEKDCPNYGFTLGLIASIPCYITMILLMISKFSGSFNFMPAYKLLDACFYPLIDWAAHSADVKNMSPFVFIMTAIFPLLYPFATWIGFKISYKQIDVKERVVYKQKKNQPCRISPIRQAFIFLSKKLYTLNYFITENLSLYLLASHSLLHCSFYRLQCLR